MGKVTNKIGAVDSELSSAYLGCWGYHFVKVRFLDGSTRLALVLLQVFKANGASEQARANEQSDKF